MNFANLTGKIIANLFSKLLVNNVNEIYAKKLNWKPMPNKSVEFISSTTIALNETKFKLSFLKPKLFAITPSDIITKALIQDAVNPQNAT